MTTRQFDPVFSAALRNELEALGDTNEEAVRPPSAVRVLLHRPQLWVSLITAVVLVTATVGVLRLTAPPQPAEPPLVVDPLTAITDPSSNGYVARAVQVLLHVRAVGPGAHDFSVPAGVTSVRVYLNCAPDAASAVNIDGEGRMSGGCSRDTGSTFDMPIKAGSHEVAVTVPKRVRYTLLLMVSPAPTVSAGALIDPLAQVRDRRNPDALVGSTTPLLRISGRGDRSNRIPVPAGVQRMRVFLACRPTSASTEVRIGTRAVVLSGCMNSIAHWIDVSTPNPSIEIDLTAPGTGAWSLLVVPAPKGAKDSPSNAVLAYPDAPGMLLAKARGAGAPASGTYRNPGLNVAFTMTCRGTGWLEVSTGDGGTNTRGNACSTKPNTVGFGGDVKNTKPQTWSVIPHGDISWTFQLSTDG